MLAIKGAFANQDTQVSHLSLMLIWISIWIFMGCIQWLYLIKGLIIIWASVIDMIWYSSQEEDPLADLKDTILTPLKYLSFNLD